MCVIGITEVQRKCKYVHKALLSSGMSGSVVLDENGDREPDYWILDMDPTTGVFIKISEVLNTDNGRRVLCLTYTVTVCYTNYIRPKICT